MRWKTWRGSSRRLAFGGIVGVLVGLGLVLPWTATPAPSTKFYSAAVAPTTVAASSAATLTVTIRNCGTGSPAPCSPSTVSTQSLGSANVTFPAGFTSLAVVGQTPPAGKTWSPPVVAGSTVQLRNPGPSNTQALGPGEAIAVTVTATAPAAAGTYCLTTQSKQSNDFSGPPGNNFTRVGSEPCVTVVPGPLDHFGFATIGSQTAGQPFGATVTAYDAGNNVKTDYAGGASFVLSGLGTSPAPSGQAPSYGSVTWSSGVGTVTGITDYKAETTTLTATDTVLQKTGTSNSFTVAAAPVASLAFLTQPTDALPNTTLTPAVQVRALDAYSNPTATTVSLGLCSAATTPPCPDPSPLAYPSGTLAGNPPQVTDATTGITTWSGLSIDTIGAGYRLLATSGSVGAVGDPFNIANDICTGTCTVHATSTGADATVSGTVTGTLSLTLSAAPGTLCGTPTVGDLITVNPVGGSGTFTVAGTFRSAGGNTGGIPHYGVCKNSGPGTPFNQLPLCKDNGNVAPCLLKLNGTGTGDLQFKALITATDPTLGGGH